MDEKYRCARHRAARPARGRSRRRRDGADAHRHLSRRARDAAAGDRGEVAAAGHALVSPSRTLGVVSLAGPARAIEVMAKNGRLDGAGAELARLAAAMPRAIGALTGW